MQLFTKMCEVKVSRRYTVDLALRHPWITRDNRAEVPRKFLEEQFLEIDADRQLKKVS